MDDGALHEKLLASKPSKLATVHKAGSDKDMSKAKYWMLVPCNVITMPGHTRTLEPGTCVSGMHQGPPPVFRKMKQWRWAQTAPIHVVLKRSKFGGSVAITSRPSCKSA